MDNDFDHEDKFGLRGYVFDIDSTGKSAMLTVSVVEALSALLTLVK